MRYEELYDGTKIAVIGFGTWRVGGETTADHTQDAKHLGILRSVLKMGCTHIDTAEYYSEGNAEQLLGKAVRDHCRESGMKREELFITSKVWKTNLQYRDVLRAMEGSLERLKMDYVDLYLVHWPNPSVPMRETFKALNELVDKGSTRHVGVSNFDVAQLKEARALSKVPIATNQVKFNLLEREPEQSGMLEYCQKNRILLTAYRPLRLAPEIKEPLLQHPGLNKISAKSGFSPAQLALSWLLAKKKVIAIPMSTSEQHIRQNLAVPEISLPEEVYRDLEELG
jgi:diketogulonate reductase-like aldo/keto reductase